MSHYDFIVIGAGVIGASVAHHLAALGAKSVLVVDRARSAQARRRSHRDYCARTIRCGRTWNSRVRRGTRSTTSRLTWKMMKLRAVS